MVKKLPPKDTASMNQVKVTLPQKIIDDANELANDQGLTRGDLYRDIFLSGLSAQQEQYSKGEVYKKLRGRNSKANQPDSTP